MLAAEILGLRPGLRLLQHRDDLLFSKPLRFHRPFGVGGRCSLIALFGGSASRGLGGQLRIPAFPVQIFNEPIIFPGNLCRQYCEKARRFCDALFRADNACNCRRGEILIVSRLKQLWRYRSDDALHQHQNELPMTRRIDPEPITIFAAIVSTYAATVATVNYIKSHYRPLPSAIRARVLRNMAVLNDHLKGHRADMEIIVDILNNATYFGEDTIRLGNGAHLEPGDFSRYLKASDSILRRFRAVHKLGLQTERAASQASSLELGPTTNVLGDLYARMDALQQARDLTPERARRDLRSVADGLEIVIADLRSQLNVTPRRDA